MADGAVVAAQVPQLVQFLRELEHLRDLGRCVPLIDQAQRLVVQELVRITLRLQESQGGQRPDPVSSRS